MSRSPLTETYKRVQGMVSYVQENLSAEDYLLFLDMVDPQPEPEAPTKKTRKKRGPRSARASGMAAAIKNSIEQGKQAAAATAESEGKPHLGEGPVCTICAHTEDYEDHYKPSPHYHPFAPVVAGKSKRKGAAQGSKVNSETGGEGVITADAARQVLR